MKIILFISIKIKNIFKKKKKKKKEKESGEFYLRSLP